MGQTASTGYGETQKASAPPPAAAEKALNKNFPTTTGNSVECMVRYGTTLDEINEFHTVNAKHEAVSSDKERALRIALDKINADFDKVNAKHEAVSSDKAPERVLRIALDEINAEFGKINAESARAMQHRAAVQEAVVLDDQEERELSRRPTLEGSSEEASVAAAAAAKSERAAFEKFITEQHGCEEGFSSVCGFCSQC